MNKRILIPMAILVASTAVAVWYWQQGHETGTAPDQLTLYGNNLTAAKYCTELQDLRGVSGSYYCVPNDGEAQWGLRGRISF